jgi:hypothetical protein
MNRRVLSSLEAFFRLETASGIVLLAAVDLLVNRL